MQVGTLYMIKDYSIEILLFLNTYYFKVPLLANSLIYIVYHDL